MDHDCALASDGTQQHCVQDSQGNGLCAPQCSSAANCALDATCTPAWTLCSPAQGAACRSDDDCPPADGTYQHCNGGMCTPECGRDTDCTGTGQTCRPLSLCQPRAGVCLGDGSFCSPCRADSDCKNGYCLDADYSTERFCSQAATGTCTAGASPGCPTLPSDANYKGVACTTMASAFSPANQCVGTVVFGTAAGSPLDVAGCWTINR